MTQVRLQKFLASAGIASRRKAEEMIEAGRVTVNGVRVTALGTKVDPAGDAIAVDGKVVRKATPAWIALHKPRGYVSTRSDPQGRPTIYELLPESLRTLFYVGRLDVNSEGLMLLTNVGDVAHRLLHPRYQVARVYDVVVHGAVAPETIERLKDGVALEDGVARAGQVEILTVSARTTRLRLTLREGRKREVRRMMRAVGHQVRRLRRIGYGPVKLGRLPAGEWRRLSQAELRALQPDARESDSLSDSI